MIEDICEKIYEPTSGYDVGHFVWCPVPHLEEVPRILDVDRATGTDHYATRFSIVQMSANHFRSKQKLPLKALSLGDTEELLISKAKCRPCVIVACHNTTYKDTSILAEVGTRKHLQDNSVIVAPIYGLAAPDDIRGFPPVMAARIKALLYNQFFYIPSPKNNISHLKEGIVRLDRLFSASRSRGMKEIGLKLAHEPLAILTSMLHERFCGRLDENLNMIRELLFDALPNEARPAPTPAN